MARPRTKANAALSDAEAKSLLRKWPETTIKLWEPPAPNIRWLRAQPKEPTGSAPAPRLGIVGAKRHRTHPDGMWVACVAGEYVDVVCVEVCCSIGNLSDKRSRYMALVSSLVLDISDDWLLESRPRGTRWSILGLSAAPTANLFLPIRRLRVLYALRDDHYAEWRVEHQPIGHEFFCPHTALSQYNAPKTQTFLKGMFRPTHFF